MNERTHVALVVFAALILTPRPSFAYIDPGTGTLLIQGLIGTIAAGAVFGRLYWQKVKKFLGLKQPQSEDRDRDDDRTAQGS